MEILEKQIADYERERFKSHHSGMEIFAEHRLWPLPTTFKSHHSGMEMVLDDEPAGLGPALNRTIVGWKWGLACFVMWTSASLNRTIVGWKLVVELYVNRLSWL